MYSVEMPVRARRDAVREISNAPNIEQMVLQRLGGSIAGASEEDLKIAEYGLLVAPVSEGLTNYLDETYPENKLVFPGPETMSDVIQDKFDRIWLA